MKLIRGMEPPRGEEGKVRVEEIRFQNIFLLMDVDICISFHVRIFMVKRDRS